MARGRVSAAMPLALAAAAVVILLCMSQAHCRSTSPIAADFMEPRSALCSARSTVSSGTKESRVSSTAGGGRRPRALSGAPGSSGAAADSPYGSVDNSSSCMLHTSTGLPCVLRGGGGGGGGGIGGTMGFIGSRLPSRAAAVKEMEDKCVEKKLGDDASDGQEQAQRLKGLPRWLSWVSRPPKSKTAKLINPHHSVMIQGFDWEMMKMSERPKLYGTLASEMKHFAEAGITIAWFPPPSDSADEQGYLPGKWYSIPHKKDLEKAVKAAEASGVVSMADVVLNHRTAAKISDATGDWTSFEQPAWEEWAIVKDDWKCKPDDNLTFCPSNCTCGAEDTGENACYAPDIDHTNVRVQADVEQWLKWLREDIGFQAFRFDNTKGYDAKYTAQYISASNPMFSVGEYFDTNRGLLTEWINASKGSSSIFDFGLRYKLKDSIAQDNFEHLTDEWFGPMIHYDKAHSVTFLDNHDTAGDLDDRFGTPAKIEMGYAFILTHPGVPCIFWQDWAGPLKATIKELISIRNQAGVSSLSTWKIVKAEKGVYAGFVGTDLAVKLGSGGWSPNAGQATRMWEGVANGEGWAVWLRKKDEEEK